MLERRVVAARQLWHRALQQMGLGDINEICLQGPNLSSSQKWAFHHDSVLLQPAMNAEEFLSLRKCEHKHSGTIAWPQLTPF